MKYIHKLPDESVNNPKENLLLSGFKLIASLAIIVTVVYGAMLLAVDYTVAHLSPSSEKKLMQFTQVDFNMSEAKQSVYLQKITDKLCACTSLPYDVKTYLLDDNSVNAFALPSGTIMITKGMIKRIKNENELASVIGHELGHFQHKDHLKGLGRSLILGVISMLIADNYGSAFTATLHVTDARYSQSQELDADIFGLDVMQCAYGSVNGATKLFERMDKGESWKFFLASHPDFHKRVDLMQKYIEDKGYDQTKAIVPLESGW